MITTTPKIINALADLLDAREVHAESISDLRHAEHVLDTWRALAMGVDPAFDYWDLVHADRAAQEAVWDLHAERNRAWRRVADAVKEANPEDEINWQALYAL